MGKIEKEIKILNVNKEKIEKMLKSIGAEKIEESLQKIYVYDLPSIYSRFYDCIMQLKKCEKPYEFEVCRNKLNKIFIEVDNLTTPEIREKLKSLTSQGLFSELLNRTDNSELLNRFSNKDIVNIIKKYGINPNKWVRLRTTNGKTTITVKHILNPDIQDKDSSEIQKVLETEMQVPSIEDANSVLEQLGFSFRNYQEKNRATYMVDGVEVDIDSWPLIPSYIEIENDSEEKIQKTMEKIGLQDHEVVSCNTADVYKKYGIDLYKFRELRFPQRESGIKVRED